ncbi:hypothetical protein [Bradyrhizobium sp. USDA 376]
MRTSRTQSSTTILTSKHTLRADLVSAGGDVVIKAQSTTNATSNAEDEGGGFVGLGIPTADSDQNGPNHKTLAYVSDGTRIEANGGVSVLALTLNQAQAAAHVITGGLVGVAIGHTHSRISVDTLATINNNAAILAGGDLIVAAEVRSNQSANTDATGVGLGGDANASAEATLGGNTNVEVGTAAKLEGRIVVLSASDGDVRATGNQALMSVVAISEGDGGGLVAVGTASSTVNVEIPLNIKVNGFATITGWEGVDFRTSYNAIFTKARANSSATGLFGGVDSSSSNTTKLHSDVNSASNAIVTATPRVDGDPVLLPSVHPSTPRLAFDIDMTNQPETGPGAMAIISENPDHVRALGFSLSGSPHRDPDVVATIEFDSNVVIYSGQSPVLIVGENGAIERQVNVDVDIGSFINVHDIINNDPGDVYFAAADHINGSGGTWEFRDNYHHVLLINKSKLDMNVQDIKVLDVDPADKPQVDISNTGSRGLTFKLKRDVSPTLIDIENTNTDPPNITLSGVIDNPIGTTRVINVHGDILSSASRADGDADPASLIRTNILDIEARQGNIGQNPGIVNFADPVSPSQHRVNIDVVDSANVPAATDFVSGNVSGGDHSIVLGLNQFFDGELVKYVASGTALGGLTSGNYYYIIALDSLRVQLAEVSSPTTPIEITPTATATDLHSLTPAQRFTAVAKGNGTTEGFAWLDVKGRLRDDNTPYSVVIDAVDTAGDANLRIWGSVQDTNVGTVGAVHVIDREPANTKDYFNKFLPDEGSALPQDAGAFGTGGVHIDSTYDIRALDSTGHRYRPGIISAHNIIIANAEPTATSPRLVNVKAITEITGSATPGPSDSYHIDVLTNGWIDLAEKTGDLRVGRIMSTANDVTLHSPARIIDALNDGASGEADVTGVNITLIAGDNGITSTSADKSGFGGIGTPDNFIEINVDALYGVGSALGVLDAIDTAAQVGNTSGIFITEVQRGPESQHWLGAIANEVDDLEVDLVNTQGDVSLATTRGSIVDARADGVGDDTASVIGNTINLFARGGNIGNTSGGNDLEIDSQAYAYGTIGARATGSIYLSEALPTTASPYGNNAEVVLLQALGIAGGDAVGGNIRFTVRESAVQGEDLHLLNTGAVLFLENGPETLVHGLINTPNGSILLRVADNVTTEANSQILASQNIDIYGDFRRVNELSSGIARTDTVSPDDTPKFGTVMHLHGVIAHGATASGYLTRIFGNADTDQIFFDETFLGGLSGTATSAIPGGTAQVIPDGGFTTGLGIGNAGLMSSYSGGKTRAFGSNTPTQIINVTASMTFARNAGGDTITAAAGTWAGFAVGDIVTVDTGIADDPNNRSFTVLNVTATVLTLSAVNFVRAESVSAKVKNNKVAPAGDSEDFFIVNQLQSMVITQETQTGVETGDTLTLDGQSASDTYVINTTGTHGEVRNYVVNVLDTGAAADGVDNLTVYGRDDNAINDPNANYRGADKGFDDVFLLRRTTGIAQETANRPVLYADDSAFVALLHVNNLARAQASDPNNDPNVRSQSVQRINYDSSINGSLMVLGQGGNDYFAVDDNAAITTLDGGADNDSFQIGQIYGYQRDGSTHSPAPLGNTFGGSVVTPYDQFPQLVNSLTPQSIYGTVATTRGWLSAGATSPLVAEGGTGDDTFTVYSNQSPLRLEGDDGNDLFTVRAFALAETNPVTGDIVWVDPVQEIAKPKLTRGFSTAAETAIRTGAGANQVEYNINAPVSVDGGNGFDKLVILGTEFADHIVVTEKGIFGAGLTVTYQNIEVLEVDALEGDDIIDVLSTQPGVATRVIGGLGNDTMNVAGDVTGPVVSRDIEGTSGMVNNRVTSDDSAYDGIVADGIDLSVARPNQGQVIIDEEVLGDASRGFTDISESGIQDVYGVYLQHAPVHGTHVYVTITAAMPPEEEHVKDGLLHSGDILDELGNGLVPLDANGLPPGDSMLLAEDDSKVGAIAAANYDRDIYLNGTLIHVPARSIVLVFDDTNWDKAHEHLVHLMAVDDNRPEGVRTVVTSHSVLSDDASFNHAIVRNVEVTIHDNDQPGILITQLDPTTTDPALYPAKYLNHPSDNNTIVLEGDATTAVTDLYAVELENQPIGGVVTIALKPQDSRMTLSSSDARFGVGLDQFGVRSGVYYLTFDSSNWNKPVIITATAVNDGQIQDPHNTTIVHSIYVDQSLNLTFAGATVSRQDPADFGANWLTDGYSVGHKITITGGPNAGAYLITAATETTLTLKTLANVVPTFTGGVFLSTVNLDGLVSTSNTAYKNAAFSSDTPIYAKVLDDETAGVFLLESAGRTLVTAGTTSDGPGEGDSYTMRLQSPPKSNVNVDVVTDGQTDLVTGGRVSLQETGGLQPVQLFTGHITVTSVDAHTVIITRASGSETGSFIGDGFLPGQRIRIEGTGVVGVDNGDINLPGGFYTIDSANDGVTASTIRLTDAGGSALPTAFGTFDTDDNKTVAIDMVVERGRYVGNVDYSVTSVPFQLFTGNISVSGNVITRNDVGSFKNDNFAIGQVITILQADQSALGTALTVTGVSDTQLTLSGSPAADASYQNVSIRKMLDVLVRRDGTSWLDSGFFEGQLIKIKGIGGDKIEKIDLITGTTPDKLDMLVLTDHPASGFYSGSLGGNGNNVTVTVIQMAARVTYTPPSPPKPDPSYPDTGNWYQQVTVQLIADPWFDIQPGHENYRAFPKVAHRLDGIRGPLAVEGGTTAADRSLVQAVLLPGEANGPLFNIPPQPPETQSIDVLNIYNDGTVANDTGTLTSTALTGFEMGGTLDFSKLLAGAPAPFGESVKYPGGISYGSIVVDPVTHEFSTDASHSTIESVNIFLGAGNDRLDINSTLIPGPDHNADGTIGLVSEHGGLTTVHGGGNAPIQMTAGIAPTNAFNITPSLGGKTGTLERTDGRSWVDAGFAVGQQVMLSVDTVGGSVTGSYTITAILDQDLKPGSILVLLGANGAPALTLLANATGTISVTDWLQVTGNFDVQADRIIRRDGLSWDNLGFAAGQQVSFSLSNGNVGNATVLGFDNASTPSGTGFGSALLLGNTTLTPATGLVGTVAVTSRNVVSGPFTVAAKALTRSSGSWIADGFAKGQAVAINGQPGVWFVTDDPTSTKLKLTGGDLTALPAIQKVAIVRIGGDTINVNGTTEYINGINTVAAALAGDPQGTTNRITRSDGHGWASDHLGDSAFAVGQQITITGEWSYAGVTFARNANGDTITRSSGSWLSDGFVAGETIVLSGTTSTNGNLTNNGNFTIKSVTASTLTLTAVNTVVPTVGTEPVTIGISGNFLVTGFATSAVAGDTLLVKGAVGLPIFAAPMTVNVDAPLVVYGDTTQDGIWYNGKADKSSSLGKFSNKPQPHMDNVSFTMATPSLGQANPEIAGLGLEFSTFTTLEGTFGVIKRTTGDWNGSTDLTRFLVDGLITIDGTPVGNVKTLTRTDPAHPLVYNTLILSDLTPAFTTFANGNHTIKEWNSGTIKLQPGQGLFDPGFVPEGLIAIGGTYQVAFARSNTGDTITRFDGGNWLTEGFAKGQTISVSLTTYNNVNFTLVDVTANTLTLEVKNSVIPTTLADPGAPTITEGARIAADVGAVAIAGSQYLVTFAQHATGDTITRSDGGSWITDGFKDGMNIAVYGTPDKAGSPGDPGNKRVFQVDHVTATVLTLKVSNSVIAEGPEQAIISGQGTKVDTLFMFDLKPAFLTLTNNGNSAPTLTRTIVERNRLGQNADFYVFPLANEYRYAGNDVIDAHNLFGNIPAGQLPTVGITAYGGKGDDTIIGSQAGDHLAGGSGNDTIIGQRGVDHIYGDSGFNVDVITRVLNVAQTAGNTGTTVLDNVTDGGNDLIYGDAPGSTATDAFGDYDDVIFGDLGDIGQATSGWRDTTKPVSLTPQRIETTLLARTIVSQSRQYGGNDTIFGNGGEDILIGGMGNDSLDGENGRDLLFGDNVALSRTTHLGDFRNGRFETLSGTQIYSTGLSTDTLAAGLDYANGLPQADPRGHGSWGDYLITLFDHGNTTVLAPAGSYGNDYIAGGAADDMIFGEMGNDVAQGDGSIEYVSHTLIDNGDGTAGYSTAIGGRVGVLNVAANIAGNPFRDATNALFLRPSFDGASDGQDYIEGGGDNDILFGNQNQDDLIGGSSDLFSLNTPAKRPDGSDLIFGGSGRGIARNAIGDATIDGNSLIATTPNGHANDSDSIIGDNGDVIRLVGIKGQVAPPVGALVISGTMTQAGNPVQTLNGFLSFNYDNYNSAVGFVRIIPRVDRLLDYTPGGVDFDPVHQPSDIGAADELHGESGDDFIYAGKGEDWLYGEGQDDDLIGGYGNDWISGGTGSDGIIGDDGRIFTNRNSLSADAANANYLVSVGEPLFGIAPLLSSDADPKYSNGNALNEYIYTPGNMQIDTINVSGALKKTVDLTPFSSDPSFDGTRDDFSVVSTKNNGAASDGKTRRHNDDIIFGGLGSDWIHGGSGDDAVSGAEALKLSYTQMQNATTLDLTGIAETDYYHPFNPGDALRFNPTDPDGKFTHPHIANRTGEFALYDENNPMRKILLNADGTASSTGAGLEWFLNFDQTEGVLRPGGTTPGNQNQSVTYGPVRDDGNDDIFGDNGNDWIVGGTGRDHTYGGWGNDLLNADDDLTTASGLNNVPETAPTYEDRAYGGAGKDVLIANTGGDRLIDWVGEYNSYLVPFSEFGMATVSRTMQPFLHHFLYAESLSDGVDATRYSDLNNGALPPAPTKANDPIPSRNGEPAGELGLVLQQDAAWHAQTGAPTDPQAGNTPGTQRDVLRSASYAPNTVTGMFVDSGSWSVANSAYQNSTVKVSGDNVSLFDLDMWLPGNFFEIQSTMKVSSGGTLQNGFIIFDYQGTNNFKYAGVDVTNNLIKIGQRSDTGWTDLATLSAGKPGLGLNSQNSLLLSVNGTVATLTVTSANGGKAASALKLSYAFNAPLNTGMVGVGTNNSIAAYTSYTVQRLPISFTYNVLEDFSDGVANNFAAQTGTWTTTSGTNGRYFAVPPANDAAFSTRAFAVAPLSYVEYSATVNAAKAGTSAGLTFAYTSTNDFLYAGIVAGTNQVVLGHRSNGNWYVDAVASTTIAAGTDYNLLVALSEGVTNNVNVVLNGKSVLNFNYNILVHDGSLGLYARNGNASFDNVLIRGDDIAYAGGGTPQVAALAAPPATDVAVVTADQLTAIVAAAKQAWTAALGPADPRLSILDQVTVLIADLPDQMLGATTGSTIVLDAEAAGWGWFVDPTPGDNREFAIRLSNEVLEAASSSPAAGHMDLLTTLVHEMGNAMGMPEDLGDDVAGMTLRAGERRLPEPAGHPAPASAAVLQSAAAAQAAPQMTLIPLAPATTTIAPPLPAVAKADEPSGITLISNILLSPIASASQNAEVRKSVGASEDPGKSFVSLSASLTGGVPKSSTVSQDDLSTPEHHSSRIINSAKETTSINWRNSLDDVEHLASGPSNGSQEWLDDFLNHVGQNKAQWNPNAGLRVRPLSMNLQGHA